MAPVLAVLELRMSGLTPGYMSLPSDLLQFSSSQLIIWPLEGSGYFNSHI